MSTQITFSYDKPLDPNKLAAYAHVTLVGSNRVHFAKVLVDSGADFVQFPLAVARIARLSMTTARKIQVNGVAGSRLMYLLPNVSLEVEGSTVKVEVLFDPYPSRPLAGRNILRALGPNYGFDHQNWLWNT